jgi:hypothetical protein
MSAYNQGDILVAELKVANFDFKYSFISFDVYESIFTPGILANITILDTGDYIGQQKLSGGEPVTIVFKPPGGEMVEYKMIINKVKKMEATPSQRAKSYVIEAGSEEIFNSKDKYVTKSYENKQFSQMVEDIFKEYLKSDKKLNVEETKGLQKYIVPSQKPYAAIDMIRRRSVSSQNESSTYMFFENSEGFHFTTLEKIIRDKKIVRTLVQDNTTGANFLTAKANNILQLKVPQQMDLAKSTSSGVMKSSFKTFNMFTLDYKEKDVTKPEDGTSKPGKERIKSSYENKHKDEPGLISVMPVANEKDVGLGGKSYIPEQTPKQRAYADALASGVMKMTVVGDTIYKAGTMITAQITKKMDTTTNPGLDYALTGDMIISAVRHKINPPGVRPRYVTVLECLKASYNEDVNS